MSSRPLVVPPFPSATWRTDLEPNALPPTPDLTPAKRRVLGAALGHFASKGFVAATTRDIAADLGMQAPSLYNHFHSKEAILEHLVLFGWQYANSRLLTALVNAGSTATGQLEALVREHVLMSCEYPRLTLVINTETAHVPTEPMAVVRNYRQASRDMVVEVLRRGHAEGTFDVLHLGTTMWSLAAMGHTAAVQFPYLPDLQAADLAEESVVLALRLTGARVSSERARDDRSGELLAPSAS